MAQGINILMKISLDLSKFSIYKFEKGYESFSHVQYADVTLIIDRKRWRNVRTIKENLMLFQMMSGIKLSYHKSSIIGINICHCWIQQVANILNSKAGTTPFSYLEIPIGAKSEIKKYLANSD